MRKLLECQKEDLELLESCSNTHTKMLFSEKLPKILYGRAPRIVKGKKWFDEKTKIDGVNHACEYCSWLGIFSPNPERHETYDLYHFKSTNELVIKFSNILFLCHSHHEAVHKGNSIYRHAQTDGKLPELLPEDTAYLNPMWESAKYLLIDDDLYEFSELPL